MFHSKQHQCIASATLLCLTLCRLVYSETLLQHAKLDVDEVMDSSRNVRRRPASSYISGDFIIELSPDTTDIRTTVEQMLVGTGGKIDFIYDHLFKGAAVSGMTDASILNVLDNVKVSRASRNSIATASVVQVQDEAVWGLDRVSDPLDDAYSYLYDGTGVTAYVLDTGIRITHSEFTNGRATCGYTAYGPDCDDGQGHGTHVAGTIGGATYGIAKNVQLVAVKILSNSGVGSQASIVAGLNYVVGQKLGNPTKPMVINMSLGSLFNRFLNGKVRKVVEEGITTVVAAGNDGLNACHFSPSASKSAITVGSTTKEDRLSSFSNRGPCVDILAPGSLITSATAKSDTSVAIYSGTSMASPHVAGMVALQLSKNPLLTPEQVRTNIRSDALKKVIKMRRSIFFPVLNRTPNLLLSGNNLLT